MLLTELRTATASEHRALEEAVRLLDPELTVLDYVHLLQIFHAFVAPWEEFGREHCPALLAPAFLLRQREALLLTDLKFFGAVPLARRAVLPELGDASSFCGAMYVMEGSSLGGQLIARHLEKKFGFHDRSGYAYFYGHGLETGRLWKDFCSLLEKQAAELDTSAVVAGARHMFIAFREWIVENSQESRTLLVSVRDVKAM